MSQLGRLQDLGSDARSGVTEKSEGCERVERAPVEVWAGLQQTVTDDAINQWRRLARGGHFEYLL